MTGFTFRLELAHARPADPSTFGTAVPNWRPGDTIPLGRKTLRVVAIRDDDADQAPTVPNSHWRTTPPSWDPRRGRWRCKRIAFRLAPAPTE
jgi:hypothetical protein